MTYPTNPAGQTTQGQAAVGSAVALLLRQARRSAELTQAEVAERTGGVVSKAALANYEAGHRSLRIDTFCAIAKALDEDPGVILSAAERAAGFGTTSEADPITVDVEAICTSGDPRLAPVRRWFMMRLNGGGPRVAARSVTLDVGAIAALAEIMGVANAECRRILAGVTGRESAQGAVETSASQSASR